MKDFAFESIAQELREQITSGTYPVGCALPSERELSARYDVSVGTVRVALKELVNEGTVDGGRGRPKTVVRVPAPPATFEEFRSFAQWAAQQGRVPGGRTLESQWRISSTSDNELLGVPEGARVLQVGRLRFLDGEIVMLEQTRYPEWLGEIIAQLPADTPSVTALLAERHDVHFSHAEHVFSAEAARQQVAARLEVARGAPLLVHRRVSRDSSGSSLEWSIDRYIAGKVMLTAGSSWHSTPMRWTVPDGHEM
ncbi:hypothetical protein BHE97_00305 [Aeromicrobium sp. PE09-221]|uniref:GntR family transcriptional regulator n=1 Tax=Aeromicrobium sp. PE09-221 TaxID=1898043 RepID=UPI000B3E67AF|nr:GntR family transcriptional regulator [Aeromicrobium sp. PE09-221]OUZ12696.1 hypothetical protein BHE97_00305 [Aeromicrobium sp. PE09-221]